MAAIPGCTIFDPRLAFGENEDDSDLANLISSGSVTVTRTKAAVVILVHGVGEHLVYVHQEPEQLHSARFMKIIPYVTGL